MKIYELVALLLLHKVCSSVVSEHLASFIVRAAVEAWPGRDNHTWN